MLLIMATAIFLTIFVVLLFILQYLSRDNRIVQDRLKNYVNSSSAKQQSHSADNWKLLLKDVSSLLDFPIFSRLLEHQLLQAAWPLKGSEFAAVCLGVSVGGFFILILISKSIIVSLVGGGICACIPFLALKIQISKRVTAFNDQLGDALVLIANSLRTGYSFMQAIDMVAKEMPPPISVEFARTLREMNFGLTTEEAMTHLAKRINSDSLDLVITAVLIQRQVGGNLSEILDNISGTIRERIKLKREIKTLTAQGRISGFIIGIMPIGLGIIIFLLNPEYIRILFVTFAGKAMLIGALISELLGILIIRSIVNIEL